MTWDEYFLGVCVAIARKSPCLSRQIGALLVRNNSIVSTGYNGPPRGVPHCGPERYSLDPELDKKLLHCSREEIQKICPRRLLNYSSGEGMDLCPAQHAEENAVSNAARNGVSVLGCSLYLNTLVPCQKCFGTLINAGINEIIILDSTVYDKHTQYLIDHSTIKIRKFEVTNVFK